jgi:hypothetical protein
LHYFYKLSEYCNLEITLWGKQGLLVIQKATILLVMVSQIFVKKKKRKKSAVFAKK